MLNWPLHDRTEETSVKTRQRPHFTYVVGGSAMMREVSAGAGASIPGGTGSKSPYLRI
jgi:hypothetical protein